MDRRAVLVLALVLLAGLAIALALSGGDDDAASGGLTIEHGAELVVYLADPARNTPDAAGGASQVTLVCVDAGGRELVRARKPWPADTDGGTGPPHLHDSSLASGDVPRVTRCEIPELGLSGDAG